MSNFGPQNSTAQRVKASKELEELLFKHPLKKREVEALRLRCQSYQIAAEEGETPEWSGDVFRAYSRYFGFLSALKVKAVLHELESYGYLDALKKNSSELIDFGAGTLGGTMGALDFFHESKIVPTKALAIDRDLKPMQWAQTEFKNFLNIDLGLRQSLPENLELKNTLFIAVDVLNEIGLKQLELKSHFISMIETLLKKMDESSIVVLIEPASRALNQNFLQLRDQLRSGAHILLPCTHELNCPAIQQKEWCHEDRDYLAPSMYWNLVHELGFQRGTLSFSMLCLSKQANRFQAHQARMVSRQLKSKGRCDKWLCAGGKRWKASLLNRHRSEQNESFFEARRGDIVDCVSTGVKSPD